MYISRYRCVKLGGDRMPDRSLIHLLLSKESEILREGGKVSHEPHKLVKTPSIGVPATMRKELWGIQKVIHRVRFDTASVVGYTMGMSKPIIKKNFIRKTFWISDENQKKIKKVCRSYKISESHFIREVISRYKDQEKPPSLYP